MKYSVISELFMTSYFIILLYPCVTMHSTQNAPHSDFSSFVALHRYTRICIFAGFTNLIVIICPKFRSILLTCAMKIAARASYKAVPSMFIVAPTGSTNLVMRLSTPLFSSKHLKVIGKVAELKSDGEKNTRRYHYHVCMYICMYRVCMYVCMYVQRESLYI